MELSNVSQAWQFEKPYTDNYLYLHSFINYSHNAFWKFDWQKNLIKSNGLKINFGSVSTNDLQSDINLIINQEISNSWRFKSSGTYRANRFENSQKQNLFMGFEKTVFQSVGLFFQINPLFEKEYIDISFGGLFSDDKREKYISLEIILEDFLYGEKNDFEGKSINDPIVLNWKLRYGLDKIWFYVEGRLTNGFERKFEDKDHSPEINYHLQKINNVNSSLFYLLNRKSILSLNYYFYSFYESKNFYETENNFSYSNDIHDFSIELIYNFKKLNNFRLQSHYLIQNAVSIGYRAHHYKRKESLNGVYYERIFSNFSIEAGYLFSIFNWKYNRTLSNNDYSRSDFSSKVSISWNYQFNINAVLRLSLSHEIEINGFGGGNLQYMMFF